MLVNLFVSVNDILKFNVVGYSAAFGGAQYLKSLVSLVDFAYSVDGAHD